jgi:hypothetical protein
VLFNAHHEAASFLLPTRRFGSRWSLELSTSDPDRSAELLYSRVRLHLDPRSLVVLRRLP